MAIVRRHPSQLADKLLCHHMGFMLLGHAGLVVFNGPCQFFPGEFSGLLNVDSVLMLSATPEDKRDTPGYFVTLDIVNSDFVWHGWVPGF